MPSGEGRGPHCPGAEGQVQTRTATLSPSGRRARGPGRWCLLCSVPLAGCARDPCFAAACPSILCLCVCGVRVRCVRVRVRVCVCVCMHVCVFF